MKLEFYFNKRKFFVTAQKKSFFGKMIGLMFHHRSTKNMLFAFRNDTFISLHSWFVFFPFLCIWLDEKMNVIDIQTVMPFTTRVLPKKKFRYVLELPFNDGNEEIIRNLVGMTKN